MTTIVFAGFSWSTLSAINVLKKQNISCHVLEGAENFQELGFGIKTEHGDIDLHLPWFSRKNEVLIDLLDEHGFIQKVRVMTEPVYPGEGVITDHQIYDGKRVRFHKSWTELFEKIISPKNIHFAKQVKALRYDVRSRSWNFQDQQTGSTMVEERSQKEFEPTHTILSGSADTVLNIVNSNRSLEILRPFLTELEPVRRAASWSHCDMERNNFFTSDGNWTCAKRISDEIVTEIFSTTGNPEHDSENAVETLSLEAAASEPGPASFLYDPESCVGITGPSIRGFSVAEQLESGKLLAQEIIKRL